MLNVGAGEIALILVVALLLLGPKRLPEMARTIGKFMREFRRQTDEVRTTLETEFYRMDQELMKEPGSNKQLPPTITGPLDGGRRPADELKKAMPFGAPTSPPVPPQPPASSEPAPPASKYDPHASPENADGAPVPVEVEGKPAGVPPPPPAAMEAAHVQAAPTEEMPVAPQKAAEEPQR